MTNLHKIVGRLLVSLQKPHLFIHFLVTLPIVGAARITSLPSRAMQRSGSLIAMKNFIGRKFYKRVELEKSNSFGSRTEYHLGEVRSYVSCPLPSFLPFLRFCR